MGRSRLGGVGGALRTLQLCATQLPTEPVGVWGGTAEWQSQFYPKYTAERYIYKCVISSS